MSGVLPLFQRREPTPIEVAPSVGSPTLLLNFLFSSNQNLAGCRFVFISARSLSASMPWHLRRYRAKPTGWWLRALLPSSVGQRCLKNALDGVAHQSSHSATATDCPQPRCRSERAVVRACFPLSGIFNQPVGSMHGVGVTALVATSQPSRGPKGSQSQFCLMDDEHMKV